MLLTLCLILPGQPPAPTSLEAAYTKVVETRKTRDEAVKSAAAAELVFEAAYAEWTKKRDELGLGKPVVPPNPADPLFIKLRDAYRMDNSPTKAEDVLVLAEVMKQCAALAMKPEITSVQQLGQKCGEAMSTLTAGKSGTLVSVTKAELNAALPTSALPSGLTSSEREAFRALFTKFQTALTEASK